MKLEMTKTKRVLCLIALMLTNLAVMADLVIIPVISDLYTAYGDQMNAVNYVVSGPALIIVVTSLLATVLCRKLDKKIVIVLGGLFFTVGSICGVLVDNIWYMCFMRTLVGIGSGIVQVVAVSMIADIYEDADQRAKITGYYNATMSFVGIAYSYFAGILAVGGNWKNVFNLYWLAVPMMIFLVLFVPSIRPAAETAKEEGKGAAKEKMGASFWQLQIFWFLANLLFGATVLYYVAVYIAENSLGDSSFSGMATSVKQLVGFLLCFGFGVIYKKLKRNTITVTYLLAAVTLVWLIFAPSKFAAVVIATVCGCCYKIAFSFAYAHGFAIVPASRTEDATAITTAVYGIGTFCSTYFASLLLKIMHTDSYTKTWIIPAVIFAVMGVVELILSLADKKKA